jgi:hypothetical protein
MCYIGEGEIPPFVCLKVGWRPMSSRQKSSLSRQILIIVIVSVVALSLVFFASMYVHPHRIYMENALLRLIYEKHTRSVHWFED